MKKLFNIKRSVLFLWLTLIGFLTITAQNISIEQLDKHRQQCFETFNEELFDWHITTIESEDDWWEPDTVWLYDESSNIINRNVYFYNEQGLLEQMLEAIWVYSDWYINGKHSYTYDEDNNLLVHLYEDSWGNNSKSSYTYDINNNKLTWLKEIWNWNYYDWANDHKYTYGYVNNRMENMTIERWQNNDWEKDIKSTYSYDQNNNPQTILTERWVNNNWENYRKDFYTYNGNHRRLTFLRTYWQNNEWENFLRTSYVYNENNLFLESITETWENDDWINGSRTNGIYDNNNVIESISAIWENNEWINSQKYNYRYDENNNRIQVEYFSWIENSWSPSNISLTLYYNNLQSNIDFWIAHKAIASYKKIKGNASIDDIENKKIIAYPNPTSGIIYINAESHIKVYNMQGSILMEKYSNMIDLSRYPKGVYFLHTKNEVFKIIKE